MKNQPSGLIEASAFWEYVRSQRKIRDTKSLSCFLSSVISAQGNPLAILVAKLEILPERVFRRVLWFYNIDYQSFESCLRRLTPWQKEKIDEVYQNLFGENQKVPECLLGGIYNIVRDVVSLEKTTVELLLSEEDGGLRYQTKSAISYDFFRWGFGFSKYPKENDDAEIPNRVAYQFLSPKNKENDFSVNEEEGGIYWFLYKNCRSNYLWGTTKKVTLKRAICPGFYLTLFYWAFMLLFAPVLIVALVLKYSTLRVWKWMNETIDIDSEYLSELFSAFIKILFFTIIGLSIVSLYVGTEIFFSGDKIAAFNTTVFLTLYVFHMQYREKLMLPTSIPWVGKLATFAISAKVVFLYHENILAFFLKIVGALTVLVQIVRENMFLAIFSSTILGFGYFLFLRAKGLNKMLNPQDEKSILLAEKSYGNVLLLSNWFVILLFAEVFAFFKGIQESVPISTVWIFALLVSGGTTFVILFDVFFGEYFEPRKVFNKKKISSFGIQRVSFRERDFYELMLKNTWLQTVEDPLRIMEKLWSFGKRFLFNKPHLLVSVDEKSFSLLKKYESYFKKHSHSSEKTIEMTVLMLKGKTVTEALGILLEKKKKKAPYSEIWLRIYDPTLGRLVVFVKKASDLFVETTQAIYFIKKIFDERCPWVSQPKEIN
jgi:hypothetical protein